MMFVSDLFKTIVRETTARKRLPRTPEPCLVMEGDESVDAYANGGRQSGALSGVYLYHLAQMCQMIRPDEVVLDIGCGPCNLLGQLAELNPRSEFLGLDMSQTMLARAASSFAAKGVSNVELLCGDMTTLNGIEDKSVDVVVSSMAFHHLPDVDALDKTFSQIDRVLKPEGAVYFNDFGRLRHPESIRYFVSRAAEGEGHQLADDYYHSLHAAFTKKDYETLTRRYLRHRGHVYSTIISPLQIVIKSPASVLFRC
ncbi:class I SAM-dependent methyltransferase [Burkholderia anthina]|uniref:class I SAM-dependent methyltransferase n=1 Tax=Burkholderia anthina TaxID=179879 RepID=UPI001ABB1AB4|nr:class I SAM-dependent methyltransferase [Burkholderia anthina]